MPYRACEESVLGLNPTARKVPKADLIPADHLSRSTKGVDLLWQSARVRCRWGLMRADVAGTLDSVGVHPGYFTKSNVFLTPTNAYAPRQIQFALRLKF